MKPNLKHWLCRDFSIAFPFARTTTTFHHSLVPCRDGGTYFVLGSWRGGGGGGANKQVLETLTCRGYWGNSLPENVEILKLENATFSIFLGEISKK